jgi:hypothetical protein
MSSQEPLLTRAGQHIHMLDDAMERLSTAGKSESPEHKDLFKRRDRIINLAMGCPAQNLRDVATLALMISDAANDLEGFVQSQERVEGLGKNIAMAASSVLEVLRTIGIRTDDLGPGDASYEIERLRADHILPVDLAKEVTA